MNSKSRIVYPEWVEKYRAPGKTIKKTKSGGYALYRCTSTYVPGKHPKSVQTYLGVITEDKGFIPKRGTEVKPIAIEYGLSHLIWRNFRSRIAGSLWSSGNELIKLGIIGFIFGSVDETYIRNSSLTFADADRIVQFLEKTNPNRIETAKKIVEREMHRAIPNEVDYDHAIRLLMICTTKAGSGGGENEERVELPDELRAILEKYKLRFD